MASAFGGTKKPNVIFILVDDMGWTGMSLKADNQRSDSKSDFYETPHLAQLAKEGVSFSQAYAPAPMCTPSRASFLTGKSPAQLHVTSPGPVFPTKSTYRIVPVQHKNYLEKKEITIAEALKKKSYRTAHFGKWHLKSDGPGEHGFDVHDGETGNGGPGQYKDPNPKDIFAMNKRAISFMKDSLRRKKPFYLQLSHYAVHSPSEALESTNAEYSKKAAGSKHSNVDYAAMTKDFDRSVGEILATIKDLKIEDNTYVIFMSDNGASTRGSKKENLPLAQGKASLYEGGIRVPLIISGPSIQKNIYSKEAVIGWDIFPTICEWTSAKKSKSIEGKSLAKLLEGKLAKLKRLALYFHFPHYGKGAKQKPQSAIVSGKYKLIKDYDEGSLKLYDLSKDLEEQNDLSQKKKKTTEKLHEKLLSYLKKVRAQLPQKHRSYSKEEAEKEAKSKSPFRKRFDKNTDGQVSRAEFTGPDRRWDKLDKNEDGVISSDEWPKAAK